MMPRTAPHSNSYGHHMMPRTVTYDNSYGTVWWHIWYFTMMCHTYNVLHTVRHCMGHHRIPYGCQLTPLPGSAKASVEPGRGVNPQTIRYINVQYHTSDTDHLLPDIVNRPVARGVVTEHIQNKPWPKRTLAKRTLAKQTLVKTNPGPKKYPGKTDAQLDQLLQSPGVTVK